MRYAGFFHRAMACLVDGLVLAPTIVLYLWVTSLDGSALLWAFPVLLVGPIYHVWFHARSGQTIGKHFANIRVVQLTGERISWKQACLRSSVDVVFGLAQALGTVLVLAQLSDAQQVLGWVDRAGLVMDQGPAWGRYVRHAWNVWYWSELVFLLLNEKRRAIHDYIAGTVVVVESLEPLAHEQPSLDSA